MGDKILGLRARFFGVTPEKKRSLYAFFEDCMRAREWLQELRNRQMTRDHQAKMSEFKFWRLMRQDYPLAYAYLAWRFDGKHEDVDWFTGLVGKLSFADDMTRYEFAWSGNVFTYTAEVWSGAERIAPAEYLKEHFGGKAVKVKENDGEWLPYAKMPAAV